MIEINGQCFKILYSESRSDYKVQHKTTRKRWYFWGEEIEIWSYLTHTIWDSDSGGRTYDITYDTYEDAYNAILTSSTKIQYTEVTN